MGLRGVYRSSFLLFLLAGQALAQVPVHRTFTLRPKEANLASDVLADGARYRFGIDLGITSADATWLYSAQWKYERASLEWIVPNVGDDWIAENDVQFGYIRSHVWQTPVNKQHYTVRVKGKRWPLASGGGGGPYDPNWESEWSGNVEANAVTITNPDATTTIAVPKGTSTVIEAAVANNGGDNLAGVPVTFNHQDPEPQNAAADAGFGANHTASTTTNTDAAGAALAEFTVSSVAGDDHIVTANTDNSNVANSGRIIAVDFGDPDNVTYAIEVYSDVEQVQADGEHSANLTATVTANGLPAKAIHVTFASNLGNLDVTNSDGQAFVKLTPEAGVTGTATVTASVAAVSATCQVVFSEEPSDASGVFMELIYPRSGTGGTLSASFAAGAGLSGANAGLSGAKIQSVVVSPPQVGGVSGDSIPVVVKVTRGNSWSQSSGTTWVNST